MTHLDHLELNLSNERIRLQNATTDNEKKLRTVWIAQLEKEIEQEKKLIGSPQYDNLSDEELLRQLKND